MSVKNELCIDPVVGKDSLEGWIPAVLRPGILVIDNAIGITSILNNRPHAPWRSIRTNSIVDTDYEKKFVRVFALRPRNFGQGSR